MEEKEMLQDRSERNKLRRVVMNAEDREIISKEEAGFVVALVERFRVDIEKKIKQLHVLQGEIEQLKTNEAIIVDLIENMVAAAERDLARQETMNKLKAAREVQDERRQALRDKGSQEAADITEEKNEEVDE
jgi:DNA invertase Pin-like site-specific DNA recombinase